MRLVFMVEELSMKALLDIILPRVLPDGTEWLIIPHNGKGDLHASIALKLRGWSIPDDKFIIVHDQDSNDCIRLKNELASLCSNGRNECLIRIVCIELESWYFGDLSAVSSAYGKDLSSLVAKRKYRIPDKLSNAKRELRKLIPAYQPVSGATKIALHMNVDNNTSHSFNVFIAGIRKIAGMECRQVAV